MDFRSLMDRWPDVRTLAADLGEKPDTVKHWRQRNSIPAPVWFELVNAARRRGYDGVTAMTLTLCASRIMREGNELSITQR